MLLSHLFFFFFKQKTAYEISACLVGSEMCIRDSVEPAPGAHRVGRVLGQREGVDAVAPAARQYADRARPGRAGASGRRGGAVGGLSRRVGRAEPRRLATWAPRRRAVQARYPVTC